MKTYRVKPLLSCLCGLMFMTSPLLADVASEIHDQQNLAMLREREGQDPGFEGRNDLQQALLMHKQTNIPHNSAASYHRITTMSVYGDSVEIEDGSWWKIASNDSSTVFSWRQGDSVVITPNNSFFSSYNYYITNEQTRTYVKANLNVGPIAFGQYSHWITSVDPVGGHVYLENNSCWCISNGDAHVFRDWAPNDAIIIGINDSWFSSYDHILINVNMNTYVRAKLY